MRALTSTRRKIEALREIIQQIELDFDSMMVDDLNSDPVVVEIFDKWSRLQVLAQENDERLKEHRKQWKIFKRQLDDLEQAVQQFAILENLRLFSYTMIVCKVH